MADDAERTEQPTPKRRAEALRKGQVAVSVELFTVANLMAVTLTMMLMGVGVVQRGMATFRTLWQPRNELSLADAMELLGTAFGAGAHVVLPILIAIVTAVVLAGLAQTRGNVSFYRLKPRASKMNPLQNVKRIIQTQAVLELAKSVLKLTVVGGVIWLVVARHIGDFPGLSRLPLLDIIGFQLGVVLEAYLAGVLALLLIALGDYAFQRWKNEKSLRMTKTEVKEEQRQSEGDPRVKSRLRTIQYERARTRMMAEVPKADVVITNPRHLAVALLYRRGEMGAPKVVAKGAGLLAARIRELAEAAGVPVLENKPLARMLYRSVKVGQSVPERLYKAVAEVLAHVYRLDRSRARAW
ncbi:MAG: flagellar biosynthesis protein FlhB [Myxococcota bacterium]